MRRRLGHELLENRRLLAVDLVFNYSLDTSDFFADQSRRDALERAAAVFESRLGDELTAISAAGSNTWTAVLSHPETGNQHTITDLEIPANTLIIFAGSRDISNLGIGGPGGYQVSGTSNFVNNMVTRGQTGIATGSGDSSSDTDFSPWGGNLSFSNTASWNYSTDPPSSGQNDFYSVAMHELGHLLGFGTSTVWNNQVNEAGQFTGLTAIAAHGSTVPLNGSQSHWASDTTSTVPGTSTTQEAAMDPQITVGTRKEFTALDWAGIADIGWELTSNNQAPTLDLINDRTINEDAAEQVIDLTGITAGGTDSQALRVTAVSSQTSLIPDPQVTYTSAENTGSLHFTPTGNQHGTVQITVTVEDAGDDGNLDSSGDNATFTRTFDVTVTPVNDDPLLDSLNDITIGEDAGEQTVTLNGISPGLNETELVRITAISNNPTLIPDPTISHTAGNANGSLKFTSTNNQHGTAQISVVVEDAGDDGDLNSAADNLSVTRTFNVTVTPVNDVPQASDVTYKPVENNLFVKGQANGLVTLVNDVDGDNLTFSVASAPSNGSLSLNADGSFTYTPDNNFNKTDFFDYVAHDGTVNSNIATVTLQIETVFPWHNSDQPADVNNDAMITPADAIWIINLINNLGSHQLSTTRPEGVVVPYVDVNRDGLLSAHDVLWIINHLNQQVVEAEGDDEGEGEGEASGNDLLPAEQPVVDEPGDSPEPTTESASQSSLPVQSPLQWQLVDDAYRSDTVNHTGQRWLDLDQADDEENDWWDFLDE